MSDLLLARAAEISNCGAYRYNLTRHWGAEGGRRLVFVMLNPSTADADRDDPTIRRCMHFARREKHDGLHVVNLYAFRSASPKALRGNGDIVGPANDAAIRSAFRQARNTTSAVVAAWGAHGTAHGRHLRALTIAREEHIQLQCLGVTASMQPKHPLYIANGQPLIDWPVSACLSQKHTEGDNHGT